jgi:hypothetical protein
VNQGSIPTKAVTPTTKLLLAAIALACVLLAGCAEKTGSDFSSAKEREPGAGAPSSESLAGGTTTTGGTKVGDAFAEAELRPVGDSEVSGNVVFKEVGSLGVQVDLEVSGLPAPDNSEEPEAYVAQVHGGSCSEAPRGGGRAPEDDHGDDHHRHEHEHGGAWPSLALLGPGSLLVMKDEYADHPEYEEPPANELPGNVDTPVSMGASADGTAAVTTLLAGVEPKRFTSGSPKYIDLRSPSPAAPEDWPALACADLS